MTIREKIYETFDLAPRDGELFQNLVFTSSVLQQKYKDTNMTYAEKLAEITGLMNINPLHDYTIFNDDGFFDKEVTEKVIEEGVPKNMATRFYRNFRGVPTMNNFLNTVIVVKSDYPEEWYTPFYNCKNCNAEFMISYTDSNDTPNFCPICGKPAMVIGGPKNNEIQR